MNENKTVTVRDLTVGMVINFYGKWCPITALEIDHRRDGYWIEAVGHYRTHRWYRECVVIQTVTP